ncbi:hypothetical protein ABPG77_005627 [Micractinium sp. CCAP 211/92]
MSKHLPSGARPGKLDGSGAAKNPALASRSEPVSSPHGGSQQNTAAEPGPGSAEGLPLSMGEGGSEVGSDRRELPRVLASGPTITYPLPAGLDLSNLTVVLTGGTSGLGLEAAKMLCAKDAHVLLLGDNMAKGRRALQDVQAAVPKARVDLFECDLCSLRSVRTCAGALRALGLPVHVLCLNAGSFLAPYRKTPDGFERTQAIFLGHFYLAHLLLPELQAATPARIIWQGSAFEQLGSVPWGDLGGEFARDSDIWQYSNSKLCSVMVAREMARRLKGTGVDVFACHPGLVDSELYSKTDANKPGSWLFGAAARLVGQSPWRGAYSLVYAAGAPELDGKGGALIGPPYLGPFFSNFFNTTRLTPLNPQAHSSKSCRRGGLRLYDETVHLLEGKTRTPLPHKLPGAYRDHPWQESAAGRDKARPVDATLEPRQLSAAPQARRVRSCPSGVLTGASEAGGGCRRGGGRLESLNS